MTDFESLVHTARPLFSRLAAFLERHPQLRREAAEGLRVFAEWLGDNVPSGSSPPTPREQVSAPASGIPVIMDQDGAGSSKPRWSQLAFTLPGSTFTSSPTSGHTHERLPYEDWALLPLDALASRCRVKADAAKLVARRLATAITIPDTAEEIDLRARAGALPDCPLWMLAESPAVSAPKVWEDLAGSYTAAAAAAEMFSAWSHVPDVFRPQLAPDVLSLAAEAQSLLMYAVADTRGVRADFEQIQLFVRVREATRTERVFLSRYMKREDRADPATWPSLLSRLNEQIERVKSVEQRDKNRCKHLNNLRFKIKKIHSAEEVLSTDEWHRIWELIEELLASGTPVNDAELRETILPLVDRIPDDEMILPGAFPVIREIDRYLAARSESGSALTSETPSPDVTEVAQFLSGREIVIVGGHVRPVQKAQLIKDFGLSNVRWLSPPDQTAQATLESEISRPEVALVLLATRWTSHSFAEVDAYCQKYATPLVRLPGGYNLNEVARRILTQAGNKLRAARGD